MKCKIFSKNINVIKVIFLCVALLFSFNENNICYGISDEFKFVIETIGIPSVNIKGEKINEEIYNIYKVFVYSNPAQIKSETNLQRFKVVEDNGKWTEEISGLKGEYYILGTDYSGNFVTNVYFPTDFVPETIPEYWNYIYNENASNSWNDISKYKYVEQLEYMKNSNILFDEIDFENNICNSYNLKEYNISANQIGLDRAFLETCSTWTTCGVISVKRLTSENKIRYATFFIKPMAANADIKSFLELEEGLRITQDNKKIKINFGASAINLNEHAKDKHIKEISSDIYINDIKVDNIKSSKTKYIEKEILYEIPNEILEENIEILNIKVKSYLYTEFSVDGLLQDVVEKNITIPKDIFKDDIVPANSISVKLLEKFEGDFIVKDLIKTKNTENISCGIVEKGRFLAIKINNKDVKSVNNLEVFVNDVEYKFDIVSRNNNIVIKLHILENDQNTKLETIATWKNLRDLYGNYFNINFLEEIGKRIKDPNVLKIIVDNKDYIINFDVIDNFLYNMNYIFLDNVINRNEVEKRVRLEEWLI